MPEDTTSADAQAANAGDTSAQAATTTSPDAQAADGQETVSLEEARKLRSEAANLRKRMKAYEEAEQAAKAAQLTEQEKLQQAHDALQAANEDLAAELMEYRVNQDISKLAAKFNFTLSFDLLAKLLDWKEIEWDEESGKPTNIEKLLEALAKSTPDIVRPEQQQRAPTIPIMSPERSSITRPGSTPGHIPTIDDYYRSRKP